MPLSPQPPPSLRYLKVWLRPFKRTMFWGSLTFLSLAGLFVWEAWNHPEWFIPNLEDENPVTANPTGKTQLTKEDSAVAADIDSLPVLLEELDNADVNLPSLPLNQAPQKESLVNELLRQQTADATKTSNSPAIGQSAGDLSVTNPFALPTQQTLGADSFNGGNLYFSNNPTQAESSSVGGTDLLNLTLQAPKVSRGSPLQEALERNAANNSSTPATATSTPLSTPSQTSASTNKSSTDTNNSTQPTQPTQSVSAGQGNQVSQSSPIPYPSVPGQGYVPPVSPYSNAPYSTVPGQGYVPPVSPYSAPPVYIPVPGQGYVPASPYTGTPYYLPPASNQPTTYNYSSPYQAIPTVPVQPIAPGLVPVTPGSGVVGTGVTPTYGSPVQPQVQQQPQSSFQRISDRPEGSGRIRY